MHVHVRVRVRAHVHVHAHAQVFVCLLSLLAVPEKLLELYQNFVRGNLHAA